MMRMFVLIRGMWDVMKEACNDENVRVNKMMSVRVGRR